MLDFRKFPQGSAPPSNQGPTPPYDMDRSLPSALTLEAVFFGKVYLWMFGGLLTTAIVSLYLANSVAWVNLMTRSGIMFFLVIAVQIGLVMAITFLLNKASSITIKGLFLVYAVSVALTLSILIRFYPSQVVFKALASTSVIYGAMAAYGLITKRSLEAWGSFLFMGLIGVIVSILINFFFKSSVLDFVICCVGVLVFAGLTAYDHQKLRVIHASGFNDSEMEKKQVVFGALNLYLDFINLFIMLLRLLGSRD